MPRVNDKSFETERQVSAVKITSPLHDWFAARRATMIDIAGRAFVSHVSDAEAERRAVADLALADLTVRPKLGLKGPGAHAWLREQGAKPPEEIYDAVTTDTGGTLVRTGRVEYFAEAGLRDNSVDRLARALGFGKPGVARIDRQDATFLLTGARSLVVLEQTCGVNFRKATPGRIVFTRVAGVSAGVLPQHTAAEPRFTLWLDPSYAIDLWAALVSITTDEQGSIVGAAALFDDVQ